MLPQLSLIREESERPETDSQKSNDLVLMRTNSNAYNQEDIISELHRQSTAVHDNVSSRVEVPLIEPTSDESDDSPITFRANHSNNTIVVDMEPGQRNSERMSGSRTRLNSISAIGIPPKAMKKRLSLPNFSVKTSQTSLHSVESQTKLDRRDLEIFYQLDKLDGEKNGKISKTHLKKWISSSVQNLNTFSNQERSALSREALTRLLSEVDENKDGYIDQEEFVNIIQRQQNEPRPEVSSLLQHMRQAAFAEVYRWWPLPWVLLGISLIQIVLFCIHAVHLAKDHGLSITWQDPAPRCSMLIYNPYRRWELWRYFSYSLVHAGIGHILLNIIMQLFVGLPLEMSHGSFRISLVYLAGVLAGSLATSTFDPGMYLAGASGGVYSLIAAHLASLILNWKEDVLVIRERFREGRISLATGATVYRLMRLLSVLVYTVCDTGFAMYNREMNGGSNTGYLAHLAGAGAGLLVGICVLKNRRQENWEIYLRLLSFLTFSILITLGILWNMRGNEVYQKHYNTKYVYFLPPDQRPLYECDYRGQEII